MRRSSKSGGVVPSTTLNGDANKNNSRATTWINAARSRDLDPQPDVFSLAIDKLFDWSGTDSDLRPCLDQVSMPTASG